jgi:hypothetical protein
VAKWLEEKLGIVEPEQEHERAESPPFNQQPSKWDALAFGRKVVGGYGCKIYSDDPIVATLRSSFQSA